MASQHAQYLMAYYRRILAWDLAPKEEKKAPSLKTAASAQPPAKKRKATSEPALKRPTKRQRTGADTKKEKQDAAKNREKHVFKSFTSYEEHFKGLLFGDIKARLTGLMKDNFKFGRQPKPCSPKDSVPFGAGQSETTARMVTIGVDKAGQYEFGTLVCLVWGPPGGSDVPWTHAIGQIRHVGQMTIRVQVEMNLRDPRFPDLLRHFDNRTRSRSPPTTGNSRKRKKPSPERSPSPEFPLRFFELEHVGNRFREFQAICELHRSPLGALLLDPARFKNTPSRVWADLQEKFRTHLERCLNRSQFLAVVQACSECGITLLQGPPGTGKTRTVHYLLNAIHVSQVQYRYNSIIDALYQSRKAWKLNRKKVVAAGQASRLTNRLLIQETKPKSSDPMSLDNILQNVSRGLLTTAKKTEVMRKPKILVAAPSNAAVDEIITRMMERGFQDGNLEFFNPPIIRIGRSPKIRAEAFAKVHLESRCQAYLAYRYDRKRYPDKDILQKRIQEVKTHLVLARREQAKLEDAMIRDFGARSTDDFKKIPILEQNWIKCAMRLVALKEAVANHRTELQRLIWVKDRQRKAAFELLRNCHLKEAEIVFATLNTCGSRDLRDIGSFDWCIVDEAAQCTEPDVLIPLQLQIKSIVLVGDPQQLPPTVFLQGDGSVEYERSLFERLQKAGHPVHMLNVQYRMHPEVVFHPNRHFYGGELLNGDNTTSEEYKKPYHLHPDYAPYLYFNLHDSSERRGFDGHSLKNPAEARFIRNHLQNAFREFPEEMAKSQIGIITPYKEQAREIQRLVGESPILRDKMIEIATVDFFQGREKDIVVLSCVRAGGSKTIGFVADVRRMNVGITRAKYALWIVGNHKSLDTNEDWKLLLDDAQIRGVMRNFQSRPPTSWRGRGRGRHGPPHNPYAQANRGGRGRGGWRRGRGGPPQPWRGNRGRGNWRPPPPGGWGRARGGFRGAFRGGPPPHHHQHPRPPGSGASIPYWERASRRGRGRGAYGNVGGGKRHSAARGGGGPMNGLHGPHGGMNGRSGPPRNAVRRDTGPAPPVAPEPQPGSESGGEQKFRNAYRRPGKEQKEASGPVTSTPPTKKPELIDLISPDQSEGEEEQRDVAVSEDPETDARLLEMLLGGDNDALEFSAGESKASVDTGAPGVDCGVETYDFSSALDKIAEDSVDNPFDD